MLRRSLNAISTKGVGSPHKRNSIKTRRPSLSKVAVQPRQISNTLIENGGSLKINIQPERITNLVEYVKFFCPIDSKETIVVQEIENLLLNPHNTHDPSHSTPEIIQQDLTFQTMNHFLILLKSAQMDYYEWFDYVLSRNGNQHEAISMDEFCNEINRISHDLLQTSFHYEHLQLLFFMIIQSEDSTIRMDRAQLDHAIKKYLMKEQQFRLINATAADLHPVSLYMRKNNVCLFTILEITESEVMNGCISLHQLNFLLSSLILMYEMYIAEYGIPLEKDLPPIISRSFSSKGLTLENPSQISDLTPFSNMLTHRSSADIEGKENQGNSNTPSRLQSEHTVTPLLSSSSKKESKTDDEMEKTQSMKRMISFKVPTEITSTVGSVIGAIRKSISFRKSATILPSDEVQTTKLDGQASIDLSKAATRKSMNNVPVEINSEFVKHLDWEERSKVINLVRHMREGDNNEGVDQVTSPGSEKSSILSRYTVIKSKGSVKGSIKGSNRSISGSGKSMHFSGKHLSNGNYIIISTDENEIDDILDAPITQPVQPQNPLSNDEIMNNMVNNSLGARRRSSVTLVINRLDIYKNEMLESFNRRVGQASILMKQNR